MIVLRILNLDASPGEYPEEEGCYQEEEEENFDHYQGKLIFLQVQSSHEQGITPLYFMFKDPIPSFSIEIFYFKFSSLLL